MVSRATDGGTLVVTSRQPRRTAKARRALPSRSSRRPAPEVAEVPAGRAVIEKVLVAQSEEQPAQHGTVAHGSSGSSRARRRFIDLGDLGVLGEGVAAGYLEGDAQLLEPPGVLAHPVLIAEEDEEIAPARLARAPSRRRGGGSRRGPRR